ncbi:MAG TPA: transglycosylase SLT domain-containing protein [Azospirillum sp.]
MPFNVKPLAILAAAVLALAVPAEAKTRADGAAVERAKGVTVVRGTVAAAPAATARPAGRGTFAADCEAAEAGDSEAAYRVARRFLFGNGVARSRRVGTAWLRAAATRGHAEARKMVKYVPGGMGHVRPYCRPGAGPLRTPVAPPEEIVRMVRDLAPKYGLDPALVMAVIQVESAFRTDAVSPKEAAGLMQLIPETADRFDVRDVFDPRENIRGGIRYLRWLLAYFKGDVTLALAGYNAGEGAVDRHRGVPPYAETQAYVQLVRRLYPPTSHPFDPKAVEPSSRLPKQTAELPR